MHLTAPTGIYCNLDRFFFSCILIPTSETTRSAQDSILSLRHWCHRSVQSLPSPAFPPAPPGVTFAPPPSGYKYSALQPTTDSFYRSHRITSQWLMSSYRSHCHESHCSLWARQNSNMTLSSLFNVFSMPLVGLSHSGNMYMSSELFIMLAKSIT